MRSGQLSTDESAVYTDFKVRNLFLSVRFNCHRVAIWVDDKLIFPPTRSGPAPNSDLPEEMLGL